MQDCYAGDIGDFGKYGLLRWLCGMFDDDDPLSLGVLWYRYEKCDGGGDTKYRYFDVKSREYECCDPDLFSVLRLIVYEDRAGVRRRKIESIEKNDVLPTETVYFSREISRQSREDWVKEGQLAIKGSQLVFFDPNTGIRPPNDALPKRRKYVYYDEIAPCWERGQSIVVYQHHARTWMKMRASVEDQIEARIDELRNELGISSPVYALRFKARTFFVAPQPEHSCLLSGRLFRFIGSPWREHFKLHTYGPS